VSSIFAADSALSRFLSRVGDLMILNVLFIVTSLPIFTIGASLTALNFVAMRFPKDQSDSVPRDYLRSFKQNFRQATLVFGVVVAAAAALAAWYILAANLTLGAVAQLILLVIWYVIAVAFAGTVLFLFPYLAKFEGGTREVFRNARLMSWRHGLTTLVVALITGVCLLVTVFYPQLVGYGLLWFLIGFSGVAVLEGLLFSRVFRRYAPTTAGV
jgi:uncharacterized membrane protein YesL